MTMKQNARGLPARSFRPRPAAPAETAGPALPAPAGELARDVLAGLSAQPKQLPSKYFYDAEGSRLFQQIMRLPEYYPTRTEHALLRRRAAELVVAIAPDARPVELLELGSGDGRKTLALCRALRDAGRDLVYRPMDISAEALRALARRFARALPDLPLQPLCGDYFQTWPIPRAHRRQVALFMGSNLGNHTHDQALRFLRRVRAHLRAGDRLVLGLDLQKDPHTVLAAYNDRAGVTAAFNLNLLRRLNRELGMDFDLDRFSHYPTYDPHDGVARSYLVSRCAQVVGGGVLGRSFTFGAGEWIHTEQSQKYDADLIARLASGSGFVAEAQLVDTDCPYALVVWRVPG